MYIAISSPMDYHATPSIRLSKEDETDGPSQSVATQQSLPNEFVQQHRLFAGGTCTDDRFSGTSFDLPVELIMLMTAFHQPLPEFFGFASVHHFLDGLHAHLHVCVAFPQHPDGILFDPCVQGKKKYPPG